jgi:hypothetical protein
MRRASCQLLSRSSHWAHLVAFALVALLALPVCGAGGGGGKHLASPPATWSIGHWDLAFGYPGSPPPATQAAVQKFFFLLAAYQALDADTPMSFFQWILVNGVTDPREQICLLWLYWNFINRAAVD